MKKILIGVSSILIIIFFIFVYLLFKKEVILELPIKNPYYININDEFKLPEAKVSICNKYFDKNCKILTDNLTITNNVDTKKLGTYSIDYTIKYKNINKKISIETIVTDLESPIITLDNSEKKYLCPNYDLSKLKDYSVSDNYDTDLNDLVEKYIKDGKLYYTVKDSSGNIGTNNVEVELNDVEKPSIILNGYENTYLMQGTKYQEPGFTAYDNCDGNISSKVKISGSVDSSTVGEYTITYLVEDSSGHKQTKKRIVHIYNSSIGESVKKNGKIVYLTFDDGPNAYTKNILEVLDKYQVKATFFVTNQFPNYQYLIKEMSTKGHAVAIHTYSHVYKNVYSSEEAYFNDLNKIDNIIYNQTGTHTKLVRFPGGGSNTISSFNPGIMTRLSKLLKEKGYVYFDWNVDSMDTSTVNSETIANNVINGIRRNNYSVVLMHDIKYANKAALDKILYYGLTNGYTFLPLDESSPTAHHSINN